MTASSFNPTAGNTSHDLRILPTNLGCPHPHRASAHCARTPICLPATRPRRRRRHEPRRSAARRKTRSLRKFPGHLRSRLSGNFAPHRHLRLPAPRPPARRRRRIRLSYRHAHPRALRPSSPPPRHPDPPRNQQPASSSSRAFTPFSPSTPTASAGKARALAGKASPSLTPTPTSFTAPAGTCAPIAKFPLLSTSSRASTRAAASQAEDRRLHCVARNFATLPLFLVEEVTSCWTSTPPTNRCTAGEISSSISPPSPSVCSLPSR